MNRRTLAALAALFALAGCDASTVAPVAPAVEAPPPPPPVAPSLQITGLPAVLVAGAAPFLSPWVTEAPGAVVTDPSQAWSSSDSTVLGVTHLGSGTLQLQARRAGVVDLIVRSGAKWGSVRLSVLSRPAAVVPLDSSPIALVDFTLGEVAGAGYAYLPALALRSRGPGGVEVLEVGFTVPGIGPVPRCSTVRPVTNAGSALFVESYGDWDLFIESTRRHTDGPVRAEILVRDPSGTLTRTEVEGRVVPGAWPTTYSPQRVPPWTCW